MRAVGIAGIVVGVIAALAVSVYASPGMQGSAAPFSGTLATGECFALSTGQRYCSTGTNAGVIETSSGTDLVTISATGAVVATANLTAANLITTAGSLGAVYSDSGGFVTNGSDRSAELSGKKSTDSDGVVAVKIQNQADLTASSKRYVVDFRRGLTDGTRVARITTSGGIQLNVEGVAEPVCDSTSRGTLIYTRGGAGVADQWRGCHKDAADSYAWTAIGSLP